RDDVVAFPQSRVLYETDALPCDLDGDGRISEHCVVAGACTGVERLNPEWLFRTPGRIEGPVRTIGGGVVTSFALTNVGDAYGLGLPLLKDSDRDGFPDVIDPAPRVVGYRDGTR